MQFLQNIAFTDPQGVAYTAATFSVSYANQYASTNANIRVALPNFGELEASETKQNNVNVQFYYWPTDAKRVSGLTPYILANGMTMSFDFDATDAAYDGMTLEQICLHYLENVILA